MKEIDRLLSEIPLDELTGEDKTYAKPIVIEKTGGDITEESKEISDKARVKTHRTGFFAAAAAALVLAVGGGMYWGITNNKINPLSFLSKNGVHSSIENQNRSLMEQAIEKSGGDVSLWGDKLVAFDTPVAPENYLSDSIDFQVIGYAYSGSKAYLFTCLQIKSEQQSDRFEEDTEQQQYEQEIREAINDEDWLKAKELIENKPEQTEPYFPDYIHGDDYYDADIRNSSGENVMATDQWIAQQVGDYAVGYYTIDMTKVSDKTLIYSAVGDTDADSLTVKLDKYQNSSSLNIDCDIRTVIGADENGLVYANVKRISYTEGSAEAELELEKELKEDEAVSAYPHYMHTSDGGMFLGNILTPVYNNNSSPFKGIIHTDLNFGEMKITFEYAFTPMDIKKIDRFMLGTAVIKAKGRDTTAHSIVFDPAIVMKDDMSGYDDFYFTDYHLEYKGDMYILDDTAAELDGIISEVKQNEKADADAYDYRNPQNEMTFVTYDKDGNMTQSAMAVYMYNRKGENGDYKDITPTICIDGEYYKVSEKLINRYKTALKDIKTKVNG